MNTLSGNSKCVVWRLLDGKPGHENQTLGLVLALEKRLDSVCFDIPVSSRWRDLISWLTGVFPAGKDLPRPHIILGAGHAVHPAVLAAKRAFGGRTVILMKPSLPMALFDLCILPQHDQIREGPRVIVTRGVLNALATDASERSDQTLFLIGGPSSNHGWDEQALIEQIHSICEAAQIPRMLLTTSRRTPEGFIPAIKRQGVPNLEVVPVEETPAGWVAEQLARSTDVWVTEDSVSMVYEALTAGCRVALLNVPRKRDGRVTGGIDRLIKEGYLISYAQWKDGIGHIAERPRLREADRCAGMIVERWFSGPVGGAFER